jgi:septum formation protein
LLTSAGIRPDVVVSDVDEPALIASMGECTPAEIVLALACAKARDVAARIGLVHDAEIEADTVIVGCDSMLEMDGQVHGKPASAQEARERWQAMAGRTGILHTGHWIVRGAGELGAVASTSVTHGRPSPQELEAYIASGEPLRVAGAFTLDGLGAPFVERIDGDPSNVIGLSLPLTRRLLADLGIVWTDLWA